MTTSHLGTPTNTGPDSGNGRFHHTRSRGPRRQSKVLAALKTLPEPAKRRTSADGES